MGEADEGLGTCILSGTRVRGHQGSVRQLYGELHRSSSERTEEGIFEGELMSRRVCWKTVQAWRTSCAKVLGPGELDVLVQCKAKGSANESVVDKGPTRSESAQGMVAFRDLSVPVTVFPACGLAPSTL